MNSPRQDDASSERRQRQVRRRAQPRRSSVRDQKVSVEHGTPGGALGVPDEEERRRDPAAEPERGDGRENRD